MNKEVYLKRRKELMEKAENLINENKIDESNTVMQEIENLDTEFENACKAQANLNAMKDKAVVTDIQNKSVNINAAKSAGKLNDEVKDQDEKEIYKNAFAKSLLNKALNKKEQEIFDKVNFEIKNAAQDASTHAILIPESVRDGIWKEIGELHPIIGDLDMTFVPGDLTITKETNKGEKAKFYDEATKTEDGTLGFGQVNLTGCELSKSVTVSWKLKKMTPDKFLAYIQTNIAERMADGLAYGIVEGLGKPGVGDTFKPEPKGIKTALEAEAQTPQVVTYNSTSDPFTYTKLTNIMAKQGSGYGSGSVFYAKNDFIWNVLANIVDDVGRPIFIADASGEGVGRIFGKLIKEEDAIPDNAMLLANIARGYVCNVNENMTMYQEEHVKDRQTDYMGYSLVDGDLMTTKAFVYVKKL